MLALGVFILVKRDTAPVPSAAMFIFRVVLSLAGAAFGAILPGFLNIETKVAAFALSAGGALAIFVVIYRINPPNLIDTQPSVGTKSSPSQVTTLIRQLKHGNDRSRQRAAIRLAKLGPASQEALPDLIEALNDSNPYVRESVAQALEAGGTAAVRVLIVALRHQKALAVIGETPLVSRRIPALKDVLGEEDIRSALVEIGLPAAPALMHSLLHGEATMQTLAAATLERIQSGDQGLHRKLTQATSDENEDVRLAGAIALAERAEPEDIPALTALLEDKGLYVRAAAIRGLGMTGAPSALRPLIEVLNNEQEDSLIRYTVVQALGDLGRRIEGAIAPLVETLRDPDRFLRLAAIITLGEMGSVARAAAPNLSEMLKDSHRDCRKHAAVALGNLGDHHAIPPLTQALQDLDPGVRQAAADALEKLQANNV